MDVTIVLAIGNGNTRSYNFEFKRREHGSTWDAIKQYFLETHLPSQRVHIYPITLFQSQPLIFKLPSPYENTTKLPTLNALSRCTIQASFYHAMTLITVPIENKLHTVILPHHHDLSQYLTFYGQSCVFHEYPSSRYPLSDVVLVRAIPISIKYEKSTGRRVGEGPQLLLSIKYECWSLDEKTHDMTCDLKDENVNIYRSFKEITNSRFNHTIYIPRIQQSIDQGQIRFWYQLLDPTIRLYRFDYDQNAVQNWLRDIVELNNTHTSRILQPMFAVQTTAAIQQQQQVPQPPPNKVQQQVPLSEALSNMRIGNNTTDEQEEKKLDRSVSSTFAPRVPVVTHGAIPSVSEELASLRARIAELEMKSESGREGQAEFRAEIVQRYHGRCMITQCDVVLEAAHLVPVADRLRVSFDGDMSIMDPHNGILLRVDLHRLFDSNWLWFLITDDDQIRVMIHPNARSHYESIHNKSVTEAFTQKGLRYLRIRNQLANTGQYMEPHGVASTQ